MTNVLLNITADTMGFAERMSYGLQVFVVGLGTVFAVLAILWLALVLFKVFAYDLPQKMAKKKAEAQTKDESVVSEEVTEVASEEPVVEDDTQLIAVITAAIAAYTSESGSSLPFRVVSFKRVSGANGWNSK